MDLNRIVSYSLRVGVLAGAALGFLGLYLWSLQGFGSANPVSRSGLFRVLASALQGNVVGVVYLGVFVLISTPVFRVAISAIFFAVQKDRKYVGITLLVLAMLLVGLVFQSNT